LEIFGIRIIHNSFLRILLIISFFLLAATFIPVFGLFFLIFIPLLTFFYSTFVGKIKTAAAFFIPVILLILLSRLSQLNTPYLVMLTMGMAGFIISAETEKGSSIEKTIIYPSLIVIGAICVYFIYSGFELSVNPWSLVQQFVSQTIEQNISIYSQLPLDKEDINLLKDNKQIFVGVFTGIFPALAVILSIAVVWINVLTGREMLRRTAMPASKLDRLCQWKAPDFIIWIFIIAGGLLLIPDEHIRLFNLNLLLIICFIYLLQGFAITSFFFQSKSIPLIFRYLFYFLIAAQQFLMIPIAAVGLFDIWVDFRKFFRKNQASI
jgi:uncharacterized protein YybS (DUF2232 family)